MGVRKQGVDVQWMKIGLQWAPSLGWGGGRGENAEGADSKGRGQGARLNNIAQAFCCLNVIKD